MHTSTHIPAADIHAARHHCEHERGARSFAIGRHPVDGYICAENPAELIAAARRLVTLAAGWHVPTPAGSAIAYSAAVDVLDEFIRVLDNPPEDANAPATAAIPGT